MADAAGRPGDSGRAGQPRPLDPVASIKVKLGVLVGVSVLVAVLFTSAGAAGGVPWWLALPVSVAVALGVTQLLAAGMTEPLRQMTEVAQRMARGDYGGRVHTDATDEVGRLARAFNTMADDLAEVDRERRDLIATVSHELRTPLTAMTAQLENLADGVVPADREHLGRALGQAERLHGLVSDLLDLSRLEAGVVPLAAEPVRVRPLVEQSVAEVRGAGRSARYDVEVPEDLVAAADPARLRQLLVNVLDNAGRHSADGGSVVVTAGTAGTRGGDDADGAWWLEVVDSGAGVAPGDRDRVFERFGTDPDGGGTGLGLAVARWAAQLHGGTLRFLDPEPGRAGARLRLEVPLAPPSGGDDANDSPAGAAGPMSPTSRPTRVRRPTEHQEATMSSTAPSATPAAPADRPDGASATVLHRLWPEPEGLPGTRVVLAAAGVGLLAGATMAFSLPGLSWTVVLLAAGAVAWRTGRHRHRPFTLVCTGLAAALVLPMTMLDAPWIGVLGVFAAAAVFLAGSAGARSVPGFLLVWLCWPLSALRGLPWLGRSLRVTGGTTLAPAVVRTIAWSMLGVGVFGLLFASADTLFASWVDRLVPDLTFGDLVLRGFVAVAVFGLTAAASYLALNPPPVEAHGTARRTAVRNRFEWLAPVLLVDAVFVVFLLAQAAVVFGGHDYLERTTGVTYAEHVHQGFGQLTFATALTLLVVWAAARWSGRTGADLLWLRVSLGLLCTLTLVVVVSALYRMHVYQEAYGFTALRLTVDVFEGWLGLLVVAVMVAGAAGRGRWLPRVGLLTGAVALLGLAAVNPDAWVADRNIDRFRETGRLDVLYLQSLSADAAGVIAERLPADVARCALQYLPDNQLSPDNREDVLAWNLGRERAEDVVDRLGVGGGDACGTLPARLDRP